MRIYYLRHNSTREPLLLRRQRRERGAPVLVAEVARRRGVGVGEAAAEEVALVGKLVDAHVAAAEPAHAVVGAERVAAVQHPPVVEDEHLARAQPAAHRPVAKRGEARQSKAPAWAGAAAYAPGRRRARARGAASVLLAL